jgi:hypothetical protein
MPAQKSHSIGVFLKQEYPSIVKSDGNYLYDDTRNGMTMGSLALSGFPFRPTAIAAGLTKGRPLVIWNVPRPWKMK